MKLNKTNKAIWTVLGTAFTALTLTVAGQTLGIPFYEMQTSNGAVSTAMMYFSFIGIWALTLAFLFLRKRNRPILSAIGTGTKGNNAKNLLIGVGIGFGMNALCAAAAILHGDVHLHFNTFQPVVLLAIFACVFVQSSAEELICRGYMYQKLRKAFKNPWVAIIGNAVLFSMLHLPNPGVTGLSLMNILFTGILFSLMVYYMDSIWAAMGAHTAWNFTQNILFGLPNSGNVTPYSVFKLDAASASNSLVYNVGFGIEGTVLAVAVIVIACVLLYKWGQSHKNQKSYVWAY